MPRVLLGLVVEGEYDKAFFSALIPRLFPEDQIEILRSITAGGAGALKTKLPGYVESMQYVSDSGGPVDRVIVVCDSNGRDPAVAESRLSAQLAGRQYTFPRPIVFHAVRRQMETWLLSDHSAIERIVRQASRTRDPLEDLPDAKQRLG